MAVRCTSPQPHCKKVTLPPGNTSMALVSCVAAYLRQPISIAVVSVPCRRLPLFTRGVKAKLWSDSPSVLHVAAVRERADCETSIENFWVNSLWQRKSLSKVTHTGIFSSSVNMYRGFNERTRSACCFCLSNSDNQRQIST